MSVSLHSLRSRLVLLLLAALTPAAAFIAYWVEVDRQDQTWKAKRDAVTLAHLLSADEQQMLRAEHQFLATLAALPEIRELRTADCGSALAAWLKRTPRYANIRVAALSGEILCTAYPARPAASVAANPEFQGAVRTRRFSIGNYVAEPGSGIAALNFAYPVIGDNKEVRAVVIGALDLRAWDEAGVQWEAPLPPGATVTEIDGNGTVILRYPDSEKWLGTQAPKAAQVREAIRQNAPVFEATGADGRLRLYGVTKIDTDSQAGAFYLLVGIPRSVALDLANRLLRRSLVSIALIVLLISGVAWLSASHLVVRPIDALILAAKRLKSGEFKARTGLSHEMGEFGQLAAVFDEFAEELQKHDSEQRQTQESIRTLNRALKVLSACSQALVRATDEDALLESICQIIIREGGYRFAWVGFAEQDEAKTVRPVASAGQGEGFLQSARVTWADRKRGRGPIGTAIRTGEICIVRNTVQDPTFGPWLAAAKKLGYGSAVALPLLVAGNAFGAVGIYAAEPDAFNPEEVELLTAMVNDLSYGIVALRTQIERDRAEAALRLTQYSVEHAGDAAFWIAPDGRFVYVNETACRRLGYSHTELLSLSVPDINPLIDPQAWTERWEEVKQKGTLLKESVLRTKDGEEFPVELSLNHVNFGGSEYHHAFAREITERKAAERKLHLQASTLEAAANAIVITDAEGRVVWVNPAFTKLTGYTAAEVFGQNPRVLKSGTHDKSFYQELWGTILSGNVWHGEITNRRKDGSSYEEEMTITPVRSADGAISHFIAIKEDITARKEAEQALRRAEEKYRHIFEDAVIGIFQTTPEGRFLSVNPALARMFGFGSPQECMAQASDLGKEMYVQPSVREEFRRLIEQHGVVRGLEYQACRRDGCPIWLLENARAVRDGDGTTLYYEGTMEDITERKHLEEQFRQAQKMEAVGRLAGGVAHDLNNMLGVIIGYSELLGERFAPGDALHKQVGEVRKAADRAASLTRQLLAFSRKQVLDPRIIDLNDLMDNLTKMLRRLIGEDVELAFAPSTTAAVVKADPGQMEQVLMNLAVNARDAMPRGGKLLIETANVDLDETYARQHVPVQPGPYVLLSVSDTGCGMDAKVLAHIFEPFFTTKELGKGTGLGLSTVYGIVKQSGGYIWVYSEPGRGTTFKIYLPRISERSFGDIPEVEATPAHHQGSETILLVEDEPSFRELARSSLEKSGYAVLEAPDGPAALKLARQHKGCIDLLLTDVVMPVMSGRELAGALSSTRENLKILYMSGFTDDLVAQHGFSEAGVILLQKPFAQGGLLSKVREVLETPAPDAPPLVLKKRPRIRMARGRLRSK